MNWFWGVVFSGALGDSWVAPNYCTPSPGFYVRALVASTTEVDTEIKMQPRHGQAIKTQNQYKIEDLNCRLHCLRNKVWNRRNNTSWSFLPSLLLPFVLLGLKGEQQCNGQGSLFYSKSYRERKKERAACKGVPDISFLFGSQKLNSYLVLAGRHI